MSLLYTLFTTLGMRLLHLSSYATENASCEFDFVEIRGRCKVCYYYYEHEVMNHEVGLGFFFSQRKESLLCWLLDLSIKISISFSPCTASFRKQPHITFARPSFLPFFLNSADNCLLSILFYPSVIPPPLTVVPKVSRDNL